jgi:putative tryptophan/tyrosine transport system substrate-binding protein
LNFVVRLVLPACLVVSSMGYASGESLGVVYPDLRDPYNKVFDTIISGVETETGARLDKYPLPDNFDAAKLETKIKENKNRVILALGPRSWKAVRGLDLNIPVVVGAIRSESVESGAKAVTGISLVPDPKMLFNKLVSFSPAIKIVSIVYNPDTHQALINEASQAAKQMNLSLDARPARDIHVSAQIYKEFAETIDGRTNALWLLTETDETILYLLLERAWSRQFVVFSTVLEYAKRGALFSMYPDNFEMGKDLGRLARQVDADPARTGVSGLRSWKTAVNIRTAKHLGIDLLSREGRSFDVDFLDR